VAVVNNVFIFFIDNDMGFLLKKIICMFVGWSVVLLENE
jgi:hypothetical protein